MFALFYDFRDLRSIFFEKFEFVNYIAPPFTKKMMFLGAEPKKTRFFAVKFLIMPLVFRQFHSFD